MPAKAIHISLQKTLVDQIDRMARSEHANRSEFIREALIDRIKLLENPTGKPPLPTGRQELADLFNEVRFAYTRMVAQEERALRRKENWRATD